MTVPDTGHAGIETIGIVSASNEAGRQLSEAENDQRDENLRRDLAGYGSRQSQGRFGDAVKPLLGMVNPFTVVNMARETLVSLGAKYHQFHVIFGAREGDDQDLGWCFELVEADGAARVLAMRKIFAYTYRQNLDATAGCSGNRGRNFTIPGDDDDIVNLSFLGGR